MIAGQGLSFSSLLYRPLFDRLGVNAILTLKSGSFSFLALDKTVGVELAQQGGTVVETMKPMIELIMADVIAAGVSTSDVDDQEITVFPPGVSTSNLANGKTWHILSHKFNPSNMGVADGTLWLQLEGDTDT